MGRLLWPLLAGGAILLLGLALVMLLIPLEESEAQTLAVARLQTALSMVWHIAIACFGAGFPLLLLVAEHRARRGDAAARRLAQLWNHSFAVLFAVGAVSGTVLSFTLGMLWPGLFARFGEVFGVPFAFESLAFFTEAIALGFWMYGRERLSPRAHLATGIVLALSGVASAVFVVCANGWMNAPTGFLWDGKVLREVEPMTAMFNAAAFPEAVHMVLAAFLVTGWCVAGAHAWRLRMKGPNEMHRRGMLLALGFAAVLTPVQFVAGDWLMRFVATNEPAKFAAAEALLTTGARAPLSLGGVMIDGKLHGAIEIPSGVSILLHGDADAVVSGMDAIPVDARPPLNAVHLAFQVMLACGMYLLLMAGIHAWLCWKRRDPPRAMLGMIMLAGFFSMLAMEAGWMVTELGRQPWVVRGYLRTAEAVTTQSGLLPGLLIVIAVFAALTAATVYALRALLAHEEGAA